MAIPYFSQFSQLSTQTSYNEQTKTLATRFLFLLPTQNAQQSVTVHYLLYHNILGRKPVILNKLVLFLCSKVLQDQLRNPLREGKQNQAESLLSEEPGT